MYFNQGNETKKNGINHFLDSPTTTSAITYKIQCVTQGSGTINVGRSTDDNSTAVAGRFPCQLLRRRCQHEFRSRSNTKSIS